MIEFELGPKELAEPVVTVRLSSYLGSSQYAGFLSYFDSQVRPLAQLRLLFVLDDDLQWDSQSSWPELSLKGSPRILVQKLAISGGGLSRQKWLMSACQPMSVKEAMLFGSSQYVEALTWVSA